MKGYAATAGESWDAAGPSGDEAIRLGRVLAELMPVESRKYMGSLP